MFNQIIGGFQLIGQSLVRDANIWWFLTPVFILWIIMEIYLGEYKREKLGWNSILANGISFSWINIASFQVLFLENSGAVNFVLRIVILTIFFLYGMFIIYTAFTHRMPHRICSWLAGPTTIYFLSAVSVLWGQGALEISPWILLDFIILYFIIHLIFQFIKKRLGLLGEIEAISRGQKPL